MTNVGGEVGSTEHNNAAYAFGPPSPLAFFNFIIDYNLFKIYWTENNFICTDKTIHSRFVLSLTVLD